MKNFFLDNLAWILSIAVGAGAIITTSKIAEAKIDSLQIEYKQHCIDQKSLELLPVKFEYIQQQLVEIKQDLKEIKARLK